MNRVYKFGQTGTCLILMIVILFATLAYGTDGTHLVVTSVSPFKEARAGDVISLEVLINTDAFEKELKFYPVSIPSGWNVFISAEPSSKTAILNGKTSTIEMRIMKINVFVPDQAQSGDYDLIFRVDVTDNSSEGMLKTYGGTELEFVVRVVSHSWTESNKNRVDTQKGAIEYVSEEGKGTPQNEGSEDKKDGSDDTENVENISSSGKPIFTSYFIHKSGSATNYTILFVVGILCLTVFGLKYRKRSSGWDPKKKEWVLRRDESFIKIREKQ